MFSWSRKLACYAYHAYPTGGSHVANKAKLTPQEVIPGMPSFSRVAIFIKNPKLCCQEIHHKKTHPNRASSFIKLKTKKILPSQAHARTWHSNSSFFLLLFWHTKKQLYFRGKRNKRTSHTSHLRQGAKLKLLSIMSNSPSLNLQPCCQMQEINGKTLHLCQQITLININIYFFFLDANK
jgi:hypothetical protein